MASHLLHPLLTVFLLTIKHSLAAQTPQINPTFLLKVTKDLQTNQYTTKLLIGTPQLPTTLVVHLSGESPWLSCRPSSPSRNVINHGSIPCSMASSGGQTTMSPTPCGIHQHNPITGASNFGDLTEDTITVNCTGPMSITLDRFLFSCSPFHLLKGLAAGATGVLGFGRSRIAFHSQMVNTFDLPRKFTVCLSPSAGFIISGAGISDSLSYTPLSSSSSSAHGYYINVNWININGRRLVGEHPIGKVDLSSTVPYTVMKSTVYRIFKKAFVTAAISMNMNLTTVAPFEVCFRSGAARVTEIELVLQSKLVKWRIDSMVGVSDSVMCLGVVDGGLGMKSSVILGGYELEDRILEMNLGSGMMGFSSSLVAEGSSCSKIRESVLKTS